MAKFKKKKPKKLNEDELLENRILKQHNRIISKMEKTEPGTPEYDKLQQEEHQFASRRNEDKRIKMADKNSRREHIGKTLITVGGTTLLGAKALAQDKIAPICSKVALNFFNKTLK